MPDELNPNHPVTNELREQWYKLCAILLFKSGKTKIEITAVDIDRFARSGLTNIVAYPKDHTITLRLVDDAEGSRIAREEGRLPV